MSRLLTLSIMLAAATGAGCASRNGAIPQPFPRPGPPKTAAGTAIPTRPTDGDAVTATALSFRGVPYVDGGETADGFDCSGFTRYVLARHGVTLPRLAADQYRVGTPIDPTNVAAGDLVFFTTVAPGPSHVGMAIGGDEFVHAPSEHGVVRVERLGSRYWSQRYLGARRVVLP
jgi:cell wall-associated NlpC family hydrolase